LDKALRRCCRTFERRCAGKSCCYRTLDDTTHLDAHASSSDAQRPTDQFLAAAHYPKIILDIRGMDCASCAPKVSQAAKSLVGVKHVATYYITESAVIEYDCDVIEAAMIAAFIQRATGFFVQIRSDAGGDSRSGTRATLPLILQNPILDTFEIGSVQPRKSGRTKYSEISYDPKINGARDILAALADSAPALLDPKALRSDNQKRAVIHSIARTSSGLACAIPVVVLGWGDFPISFMAKETLSLILAIIVMSLSWHIYASSARTLFFLRTADTYVLVAVSTSIAFLYSTISFGLNLAGYNVERPFFETPTLLLALIQAGLTVQIVARRWVVSGLSMEQLQPASVVVVDPAAGETYIDPRLLHYHDLIRVPKRTVFAADGIVVEGTSLVDESALTGEALPVSKQVGTAIYAGTTNMEASLDVQVTKLSFENTMAQLADLVSNSRGTRLPIEDVADKIATAILVVSSAVAVISLLIWLFVERFIRDQLWSTSGVIGLTYAIAVMAVACPCALVLAVSLAIPRRSRRLR
jgi:cation transport ATPase